MGLYHTGSFWFDPPPKKEMVVLGLVSKRKGTLQNDPPVVAIVRALHNGGQSDFSFETTDESFRERDSPTWDTRFGVGSKGS